MLEITVIAVGEKMPAWVQAGYDEYARRVRGRIALQLREVTAERRGKGVDTDQAMRREAARIRQAVPAGHRLVALDRRRQPGNSSRGCRTRFVQSQCSFF